MPILPGFLKRPYALFVNWQRGRGYRSNFPKRLVILLTNPRSGSTWLFDALRVHPAIYMHSDAGFYHLFKLIGNRYPRDLIKGANSTLNIEIRPGSWVRIPDFHVDGLEQKVSAAVLERPFAIEKIHPEFYGWDPSRFVDNLRRIAPQTDIRLIYQVRDPRSSIISFMEYQRRDPTWCAHVPDAAAYMERTYACMLETATLYPGLVMDFDELVGDFSQAMTRIFGFLWPEERAGFQSIIDPIEQQTRREKRTTEKSTFFGKKMGAADRDYSQYFAENSEALVRCDAVYADLLKLRD